MAKYREKMAEVEAVEWDGEPDTAKAFLGTRNWRIIDVDRRIITVECGNNMVRAHPGDFLLKDASGHIYAMKPEAFARAYEAV